MCKGAADYEAKKDKKVMRTERIFVVHHCIDVSLGLTYNTPKPKCGCREERSEEWIEAHVKTADVVWTHDRSGNYFAVYNGWLKKTARGATVESAHIERLTDALGPDWKDLEEEALAKLVEEDEQNRTQEEQLRIKYYKELEIESYAGLIREYPDHLFVAERDSHGNLSPELRAQVNAIRFSVPAWALVAPEGLQLKKKPSRKDRELLAGLIAEQAEDKAGDNFSESEEGLEEENDGTEEL
jgi:hypothetical protein